MPTPDASQQSAPYLVGFDQGARFHRCDLQVHTPRDRNWNGPRPTNEAERAAWADGLIAKCRLLGLDAIAITDHHDTVMIRYVREAALRERDAQGNAIPEEQRVVVFPAMELTLNLPCQCLLIFDADLPLEHLDQLPGILGYAPAPASEEQGAAVQLLAQVGHPNDVTERLEAVSYLRDRFIVLPHVRETGHKTIIRAGFHEHYKRFTGVGGYVDGQIPPEGTGARNILDGKDANYGNKALALFQTSDCRRSDFATLGQSSTWIKWAKPTAEALRQSCLARHSRVSQEAPKLPDIQIRRIDISNSIFLGRLNLFTNPQYNALIGGRGTGKSTSLEYLRWALCTSMTTGDVESLPEFEKRNQLLIEQTLAKVQGQVRVWGTVNGVEHVVDRKTTPPSIMLKVGAAEFRQVTEEEVRRLFPIESYSQKQLSSIGGTRGDILTFLLAPVSRDVKAVEDELRSAGDGIRATFGQLQAAVASRRERAMLAAERDSAAQQREAKRAELKGLNEADLKVLRDAEKYAEEGKLVEDWRTRIEGIRAKVDALSLDLRDLPRPGQDWPEAPLLLSAHGHLQSSVSALRGNVEAAKATIAEATKRSTSLRSDHAKLLEAARARYKEALQRSQGHQATAKEIERLNSLIAQHDARLVVLDTELTRLQHAEADFNAARAAWRSVIERRGELTRRRCDQVAADSKGEVRGIFSACADAKESIDLLAEIARGARLRADKLETLTTSISGAPTPLDEWERFLEEIRSLIGIRSEEAELPHTPTLRAAGFTDKELRGLAARLDEETWLRLRLAGPRDQVEFEYRTREGTYIPFHVASAGQRATSLMRLLLAQTGGPLVIDQPEDDLDNRVIHEIAESIPDAKTRRQLLFASHNANLVVNGDADLIAVFDYKVAGEQTAGEIAKLGAIDDPSVREAVTTVMEGGRNAFILRKRKYGF